jgi:hypothetical protein
VLTVAALAGKAWLDRRPAPTPPDPYPLPPVSPSPFLNTRPDARYVGSEACRSCHPGSDASFRRTGMGRSMTELDPGREPPDASLDHTPSKRRYEVRRKDGRLWHRELLQTGGPQEVVLSEYPVKYAVGSGNHARMYLVEAEGFLVESPLTWYASRRTWDLSPGYDRPDQSGFARPIPEGCLYCHAGRAAAVGGSMHRLHVSEPAIGCERCHGPGSLHVALQEGRAGSTEKPGGGVDLTIVNPAHLSRDLAEAVCQQCHLHTRATAQTRGRKEPDYRPGLPLQDFRQEYALQVPNKPMTIVGHVEQMHLSRCYQATDTFSCLTCHDPHDFPPAGRRDQYYNAICMDCHRPETCTVSQRRRQQESPENSCIQCHMPRTPTEVPHVAFTHHRVGIPGKPPPVPESTPGQDVLRPLLDVSRLSEVDRKRSLGLAYLDQSTRTENPQDVAPYQRRALELLSEVRRAGLRDAVLDASLARVRSELGLEGVLPEAERALEYPDLEGQDRCVILYLYAYGQARAGEYQEAVTALRQLTGLRRHQADWLLLADCEKALGNQAASAEALAAAARINPRLWEVHQYLADYYRRQGDAERAAWHRQRAVP